MDYLYRLGGGTLELGAGTFTLRNCIYLRQGVSLRGSGAATQLKKAAGFCSRLTRDADWYENQVTVEDASGFTVGCGIMITGGNEGLEEGQHYNSTIVKDTVVAIEGNTLFLSRRLERNAWIRSGNATATTAFSLLTAIGERGHEGGSGDAGVRMPVGDLTVSSLALDGNAPENPLEVMSAAENGNYGGAVFLQHAHRIHFEDVTARNWNGDGFSFQVCDDITFKRCTSANNQTLGFHPGSGSQRPVFEECHSFGNAQGLFFCWGVTDGRAERCVFSDNRDYGISIGHRDTDNVIVRPRLPSMPARVEKLLLGRWTAWWSGTPRWASSAAGRSRTTSSSRRTATSSSGRSCATTARRRRTQACRSSTPPTTSSFGTACSSRPPTRRRRSWSGSRWAASRAGQCWRGTSSEGCRRTCCSGPRCEGAGGCRPLPRTNGGTIECRSNTNAYSRTTTDPDNTDSSTQFSCMMSDAANLAPPLPRSL